MTDHLGFIQFFNVYDSVATGLPVLMRKQSLVSLGKLRTGAGVVRGQQVEVSSFILSYRFRDWTQVFRLGTGAFIQLSSFAFSQAFLKSQYLNLWE